LGSPFPTLPLGARFQVFHFFISLLNLAARHVNELFLFLHAADRKFKQRFLPKTATWRWC
jgi:hypothetical protein